MDPEEPAQDDSAKGEIVVSPEQPEQNPEENPEEDSKPDKSSKQDKQAIVNSIKQKVINKPKKMSPEEINSYDGSVDQISQYPNGSPENLNQAIDNLIDLSHDIEFGTRLTSDSQVLDQLQSISKDKDYKERVYRIVGASFRNNPDSVQNFMKNKDQQIEEWITEFGESLTNDLIKKRILGIFQGLVSNSQFKSQHLNLLLDKLVSSFPKLDDSSKDRLVNILEDLLLINKDEIESRDEITANTTLSQYLQHKLETLNFQNEAQLKLYYNALLDLHDQDSSLKPSKSFVAWLDEESGKRSQNIRERDGLYSGEDKEFDKKLLETRHLVFGNPNAMRKHFDDEL